MDMREHDVPLHFYAMGIISRIPTVRNYFSCNFRNVRRLLKVPGLRQRSAQGCLSRGLVPVRPGM